MTLSIDIGGSKIAFGLVELGDSPKVSEFKKIETPKDKERFLDALKNIISEYKKDNEINKICIGCAGLINKTGKIIFSPNLQFLNEFDLQEYLTTEFNTETVVANDVQCFTLAEATYGAGKGFNTVIGITVGTDVGGEIIINGQHFGGSQNFAGEFGHTIINADYEKRCSCGKYGCWKQFVGREAVERNYFEITKNKKTAREIEILAQNGNSNAIASINRMSRYLGIGIINIINSFNPDIIVVGGGIITENRNSQTITLLEDAIKYVQENLMSDEVKVEIKPSELGYSAVLIGATLMT